MIVSSDVIEKAKAASSAVLAFIGALYADSEFISECGFNLFETYVNKASKARKYFDSFTK